MKRSSRGYSYTCFKGYFWRVLKITSERKCFEANNSLKRFSGLLGMRRCSFRAPSVCCCAPFLQNVLSCGSFVLGPYPLFEHLSCASSCDEGGVTVSCLETLQAFSITQELSVWHQFCFRFHLRLWPLFPLLERIFVFCFTPWCSLYCSFFLISCFPFFQGVRGWAERGTIVSLAQVLGGFFLVPLNKENHMG